MSLASVPSPFRLPSGDDDRLGGHRGPVGSKGRHSMHEPPGVIPRRTILAHVGTAALLSEPGSGHDDSADDQERLQLQEGYQLVVVAPPLVRDPGLSVARAEVADLVRGLLKAGRIPQGTDLPPHQAPQLAANGPRPLRTRRS